MSSTVQAEDPIPALLERERERFLAQLARIPADRLAERPSAEEWCAAEVVEHVARVDIAVTKVLAFIRTQTLESSAEELAAARLSPARADRVRGRGARIDDRERVDAPDRVRPTGRLSPDEALAQLAAARAALLAGYRDADASLLDGTLHPHPVIGPLTLRGWFELAAHHDARHAKQLAALAEAFAPDASVAHRTDGDGPCAASAHPLDVDG